MTHPFLTNDAFDVFYITKRTQNNHVPIYKHKIPKGSGHLRNHLDVESIVHVLVRVTLSCIRSKRDNCAMNKSITRQQWLYCNRFIKDLEMLLDALISVYALCDVFYLRNKSHLIYDTVALLVRNSAHHITFLISINNKRVYKRSFWQISNMCH